MFSLTANVCPGTHSILHVETLENHLVCVGQNKLSFLDHFRFGALGLFRCDRVRQNEAKGEQSIQQETVDASNEQNGLRFPGSDLCVLHKSKER